MLHEASEERLDKIFKDLSKIPFEYKHQDDALKRITELGKQAFNSHTFAIALILPKTQNVTQVVCTSNNPDFEELINYEKKLWDELVLSHSEAINLIIREKYDLKAVYRSPLSSVINTPVGYIYHCTSKLEVLTKSKQSLLKSFAIRAVIALENIDYYKTFNPLETLCNLSEKLMTVSSDEFIQLLPDKACELFSASACILWKKDAEREKFKILATGGEVDDDYKQLELDSNFISSRDSYFKEGIFYLPDITQDPDKFLHRAEVQKRQWVSILSAPLIIDKEIIGILDLFTTKPRDFTEIEQEEFKCFSNYAALSQQITNHLKDREKLQKLTEIMQKMISNNNANEILKSFLNGALELFDLEHQANNSFCSLSRIERIGEISRLNYSTGKLEIIEQSEAKRKIPYLKLGEGLTGKALKDKKTLMANDVLSSEWQGIYINHWLYAKSEIAVPIVIENIPVRVPDPDTKESKVDFGDKLIGVLNIEASVVNAFSKADEKYLSILAGYAGVLIEKRESDGKLRKLRQKEQEITNHSKTYSKIMEDIMQVITEILGFEMVNISLVNFETKRIRTEYIIGISNQEKEQFKKDADHSLDDKDIQSWIVKHAKIVVPDLNDERLDQTVFNKYGHKSLVRIFMPMIESSTNRVIGTLEAGYKRDYRRYIYDRDVQILENFIDYAVQALERRKSGIINRITHELRSPMVGIRSNASFIRRRFQEITPELIDRKLEDILIDCEILLYEVADLEYIMGGHTSQQNKIEEIFIFRDVIIKTINQLRPVVIDKRFSIDNICYSKMISKLIGLKIQTDKAKLNQVVYNLLMNSIKYAKENPNDFRIFIDIDNKNKDNLIIKFKDWGIGIKKEYETKIFKEGFRCPEAISRNVNGSGLGLAISKSIMKKLGGDLILSNNAEPTEFHLIIPK
ncbi:GAF domain-containing protein [Calothrix rhizosoleniae]